MKRILYIEDSPGSQLLMRRQLAGLGDIALAATLAEGRLLLSQEPFDLLLADVSLPDGNSLDLVRELRTRLSPAQLPIIIISVSMDRLLTVQSLRAGANECFSKPAPWRVLIPAVQRMLEQPYVRESEIAAVAVTWLEGTIDNRSWLCCPELNLMLQGLDMDHLRENMTERVRAAVAAGHTLPLVSHVRVTERLVPTDLPPGETSGKAPPPVAGAGQTSPDTTA